MSISNLEKVASGGLLGILDELLRLRFSAIQMAEAQHQQISALSRLSDKVRSLIEQESSSQSFPPGLGFPGQTLPFFTSISSGPLSFEAIPPPPSMSFLPRPQPIRVSMESSSTTTTSSMRLDACGGAHPTTSSQPPISSRPTVSEWASAAPWAKPQGGEESLASRLLAMTATKAAFDEERNDQEAAFARIVTAVMEEHNRKKGGEQTFLFANKISQKILQYEKAHNISPSVLACRDPSYSGPTFQELLKSVPGMVMSTTMHRQKKKNCFSYVPIAQK